MKGILIYQPTSKSAPLADFIDGLDPRLREKILLRLYFLTQLEKPEMKEPHFKRFSIERYRDLWELRVKSKVLIRIIFYTLPNGDVLLLHGFVKRQKRDTMQALEQSISLPAGLLFKWDLRRKRLSRTPRSPAGITANSLAEPSTLFITAITRSRGHNPWGSARVGAIAHLGSTYYAVHYIYSGIGRMAVNDELAAFHNHTNFGKDTQRAFLFAGASYADIIEELKVRDEKRDTKLIRYSEAYRGLHYPVHLLSCDETGARQLQIMAVPDYRVKLSKLMLRSAYRPPPEDAPAWDATYQNRPFVIGADMNLRRIDAAIASAKKRGCLPISLAALDAQGDAVLLRRYKDTGYAVIYKVTESVLTELFGRPPSLYLPPCTQYLTKKGAVVDAPLIQVDRKDRGSPRK